MSVGWSSLPLIPLRCMLEYLSLEDALAATSTCRHWRQALFLYQGHKDTLKLKGKFLEKSIFLASIFKRYTRRLHAYIDCSQDDVDAFMITVLPQFFDALNLQEIIFVGPCQMKLQISHQNTITLKRLLVESIIFKHLHCIQKVVLMNCEMDAVINNNDRYVHKNVEYYSRQLKFSAISSHAECLLSKDNVSLMAHSTLQHILLDYEQVSTEALETLSLLSSFSRLTLSVWGKQWKNARPIDWGRLEDFYDTPLELSFLIIALPPKELIETLGNVFVRGLHVTSIKVMYCIGINVTFVSTLSQLYNATLREVVWSDCPAVGSSARFVKQSRKSQVAKTTYTMNPFVLLCWQCKRLQRLAIYGHWLWQYDLVGMVRLCPTLERLEVPALYPDSGPEENTLTRVIDQDAEVFVQQQSVQAINELTKFKWEPIRWDTIHPGLQGHATTEERLQYIAQEATLVLDDASH